MISKILISVICISSTIFCMENALSQNLLIKNDSQERLNLVYSLISENSGTEIGFRQAILPNQDLVIKLPNNIDKLKSLVVEREPEFLGRFGISLDGRLSKSRDLVEDIKKIVYKGKFIPSLAIERQKQSMGYFPYNIRVDQEKGLSQTKEKVDEMKVSNVYEFLAAQFPLVKTKLGTQPFKLDTCLLINAEDIIPVAQGASEVDIDQTKERIIKDLEKLRDQESITTKVFEQVTGLVEKAHEAIKAKLIVNNYPVIFGYGPLVYELMHGNKSKKTMDEELKDANNSFREYLVFNCK